MAGLGASGSAAIVNLPQQQAPRAPQPKGSFLTKLLPTIGGIGGGVGGGAAGGALAGTAVLPGIGTAVGGLLGALLGGAAGGAGGKLAENKLEGQSLGSGVAKEALTNGVLSAGPLRLLKGAAEAGKVVKAGTGLADALKTGGAVNSRLAAPSFLQKAIAGKTDSAATNLAQKSTRLNNKNFNTEFANTHNQEVGDAVRQYGIHTMDVGKVKTDVLQPAFDAHAAAVKSIGSIPKADVLASVQAEAAKHLSSADPVAKQFGQSMVDRAKGILDNLPDNIPASKLNSIKSELAAQVNHGATDSVSTNANNLLNGVSSAFKNTINNSAEKLGIGVDENLAKLGYTSTKVGDLGNELSKVQKLVKQVDTNSRLGMGNNPISLTGGIVGAGLGGPAGAAAGIATQAINSGAGKRALARGAENLATKAKNVNPNSVARVTGRVAPIGLAGALSGAGQSSNAQTMTDPMTNTTNANISTVSSPVDQNATQAQDNSPLAPQNVQANVQKMAQNGAKMKDIVAYVSLVESLQKLAPSQPKPLTGTQAQQATNAQSGLDSLATLQQQLQKDPSVQKKAGLPGGSLTASLTGTGTYKAAINNATDVIGRLRSGGAIGAEEQKNFMRLLPQTFDDAQTVNYKLNQLNNLFQRFANPNPAQPDQVMLGAQ